jgi:hypothetical protein
MDALSEGESVDEKEPSVPPDRRKYKRVVVEIPGKVFLPSTGKEANCTIKNVSPAGAEIACALQNLLDTPVVIYAAGLGRFEGHVVWEIDGRRGVKFNSSELKQARLANRLNGAERRWHARTKENRFAQFTRDDGSVIACTIRDFSTGGVLVESSVRPRVGEFILMGGMVGCIMRVDAAGIGIEFVEREQNDADFKRSLNSLDQWRTEDGR